jgi:hypothetical protein
MTYRGAKRTLPAASSSVIVDSGERASAVGQRERKVSRLRFAAFFARRRTRPPS